MIFLAGSLLSIVIALSFGLVLRSSEGNGVRRPFALIFLCGFALFQGVSPIVSITSGDFQGYRIRDPEATFITFVLYSTLFLLCFLISYFLWQGLPVPRKKSITTSWFQPLSYQQMVGTAVGLCAVSVLLRELESIQLVGDLAEFAAISSASVSGAVIAFVVGRQPRRAVSVAIFGALLAINIYTAGIGSFGRRPFLAIGLSVLWGLIWGGKQSRTKIQEVKTNRLAWFAALVSLAGLAAFSATREHSIIARQRSAHEVLAAMGQADVWEGIGMLLRGQDAGAASMWVIENYPENRSYRYFEAAAYAVVYPVPRTIWKGKPWPLSNRLHYEAGFRRLMDGTSTRGPGIIGHGAAEGGVIVLGLYGFLLGMLFNMGDRLVMLAQHAPMRLLGLSGGFAHLMAVPRGDTGSAIWRFGFMTFTGVMIAVLISSIVGMGLRSTSISLAGTVARGYGETQ